MPPKPSFSQRLFRLPGALLSTADHVVARFPTLFGPGADSVTGPER